MLVEVNFMSKKEGKWKRESGAMEGGRVWVAFIGPEQCRDVEAERYFGRRQRQMLQCIVYDSGEELGGGETEGRAVARRGRGGCKLILVVTLHDTVALGRSDVPVAGGEVGRREVGPTWPIVTHMSGKKELPIFLSCVDGDMLSIDDTLDSALKHSSIIVICCLLMIRSWWGNMKIHCSLQLRSMRIVNWCCLLLPLWRRRTIIVGVGFFVLFEK
jgi:hypothetical protein